VTVVPSGSDGEVQPFVIRAVPPEGAPVPASEVVDDADLEADEDDASEQVGEDDGGDRPD